MDPFLGEIRIMPYNFAPVGWALCQGQILPIAQYTALFSLLGTTFGGNGTSNFGLPNFQGNVPVDAGQGPGLSNYPVGERGGETSVTLLANQMPAHSHPVMGLAGSGDSNTPVGHGFAQVASGRGSANLYAQTSDGTTMVPTGATGGSQPHNNMAPYLALNFCIAMQGIYPTRS